MKDEQINIAMAKSCGWEVRPYSDMLVWYNPKGHACPVERGHRNKCLPDYLNDLNVMHEAEKMLTEHQWDEYERVLRKVCDGCSYFEGAGKELLHATAAQRAEAFLRTLGKWEEKTK
jgi:hypothetical protein